MICPSCSKEVAPDGFFCVWCERFLLAPDRGVKAGLFRRWVALAIDPLIGIILYLGALSIVASISREAASIAAVVLLLAYFVWYFDMLRKGTTPGKRLLGLQVVRTRSEGIPGFKVMFVREVVGRFLSALVFGLGYLWAVFDKNAQAWHDKLAGTVVVHVRR